MASIQPNIVDLDDLLIQITNINDNGTTSTTFTTAAAHGISVGDEVVISNCSTAGYNATVAAPSATVTATDADLTGTTFTIATTLGAQNALGTGQVIVDDVAGSNVYFTPEITIDVVNSTFTLNQAGNLAVAGTGVTGQALYSFFKERWKEVPSITKYAFPMLSITNEQFEFQNGWVPSNDATRKAIRTAGWAEVSAAGVTNRRYAGIITLGTLGDTDQPYYTQDDAFTAVIQNTTFTGPVNEAVPIFTSVGTASDIVITGGAATGTITTSGTTALDVFRIGDSITVAGGSADGETYTVTGVTGSGTSTELNISIAAGNITGSTGESVRLTTDRAAYFKIYVRTRKKTYADADLVDIGVSTMTTIVYRFPVTNGNDLNINTTDDNAFTGSLIATLAGDGTTTTVTTGTPHGLYDGAPITISNTTEFTAGNYTVSGEPANATTFTITSSFNGTETVGGTEAVKLQYVSDMSVSYLQNPATSTGNVRIRGNYTNGTVYALGDVVLDSGDSQGNGADRWYYVSGTAGTANGNTMALDAQNAWTLWSSLPLADHGEREIATGIYSAFSTIFDLNSAGTSPAATKEIAYEYAQYILRDTGIINTGDPVADGRNGNIADPLVYFIGSQLHTYADTEFTIEDVVYPSAVYAADIAAVDKNSITFHDWEDNLVTFPLTVLVTINFNDNLDTDQSSQFYAYYTSVPSGNFGTVNAVLVRNDSDNPVFGSAFAQTDQKFEFNYAYDGDTTGGRSQSTPTPITVVAIGLEKAQYVVASGTITPAGATISLVSPLERNYDDPGV